MESKIISDIFLQHDVFNIFATFVAKLTFKKFRILHFSACNFFGFVRYNACRRYTSSKKALS